MKDTFPFSNIVLRSDESIEDCILKLYDLGFITDVEITIEFVASLDMKSKILLLKDIIVQLQKDKVLVFILAIEYFKMHIKNYTDEAKDRFIIRLNKYAS